jgi:hypothetical protein
VVIHAKISVLNNAPQSVMNIADCLCLVVILARDSVWKLVSVICRVLRHSPVDMRVPINAVVPALRNVGSRVKGY